MLTRKAMWERHAALGKMEDVAEQQAAYAALHHEYYIQFATDRTRRLVAQSIGRDRILASQDPHFNDIPLNLWDGLEARVKDTIDRKLLGEAEACAPGSFVWSLSTAVCIAKAVAREMRESGQ